MEATAESLLNVGSKIIKIVGNTETTNQEELGDRTGEDYDEGYDNGGGEGYDNNPIEPNGEEGDASSAAKETEQEQITSDNNNNPAAANNANSTAPPPSQPPITKESVPPPRELEEQPQVNNASDDPPKQPPQTQPETKTLPKSIPSLREKAPPPSSYVPLPTPEDDATTLHRAFKGKGCDVGKVVQILVQRDSTHRSQIAYFYKKNYDEELSDRISSEFSRIGLGDLKEQVGVDLTVNPTGSLSLFCSDIKLLIACLDEKTARDEGTNVDLKMAEDDAKQLYKDGEKIIWGTNEKTFVEIFSKRNRPHLAAVDGAYENLYGHSLEEAVKKETSGSFEAGLLTLLKCAKNSAKYFAEVLYNAMNGLGTSNSILLRTVVTKAGSIEMEDIKKEYSVAYKISLLDAIHKDTSGHYRTFLINLVV